MADTPRKLPALGFAGFENSPAAGGRRRKNQWPLRPMEVPQGSKASDAACRFVNEADVCAGLGRKPERTE
jgi:hypothetical protein